MLPANRLLWLLALVGLLGSASGLRCLQCMGTTCSDLIYRVGTTIVECDDRVRWCQKFVFYNGVVHRSCADPDLNECTTNDEFDATYGTAIKYCCTDDLCNASESLLSRSLSRAVTVCLLSVTAAILGQFYSRI